MNLPLEDLAAVVLVGGASRRMGRDKAHLPHPSSGVPLLVHQLRIVAELARPPVMVSARQGQTLPPLPPNVIRIDDDGVAGPLGGMVAALRQAEAVHLLVVAVDLPFLTTAVLQRLAAAIHGPHHGVYAQSPAGPEPLVSIVPIELLAALTAALARGEHSPRLLFTGRLAPVMKPVGFDTADPFRNWNRPNDI